MRTLFNSIVVLAGLSLALSSCKKDPPEPELKYGNIDVKFEYVFGSNQEPFEIGKQYTHPKTGDVMTFSLFKFYVSNIKLKKDDGTWWVHPDSYFLLDAKSAEASTFTVSDIPAGTYTEMEYTMGVDSFMNVSGVYEGALSLTNNMFWDWNSGFIMLKAEGDSPNAPSPNKFALHLGGFKGEDNIVTVKTTNFENSTLTVTESGQPTITMLANPARLWHNAPKLDSVYVIHSLGPVAVQMANGFYGNVAFKSLD